MKDFEEILIRVKELNTNVAIRKAELQDAHLFVTLFNQNYIRKTNSSYFEWQFFNSNFPSALFLAFESGELIGFYGVKVYDVLTIGKVAFAIDFLIHENARKKGIAILLDQYVREFCVNNHVHSITALPNSNGNAAFSALGYRTLSKIDTLIYDLSMSSPICSLIKDEKISIDASFSFSKDTNYLDWRFNQNPIYSYDFVFLNENCYAYIKVFIDPVTKKSCGDLVHLQAATIQNAFSLINLCIEKVKQQGIQWITIWALPHCTLFQHLIDAGFMQQEHQRYFCLRVVKESDLNQLEFSKWQLEECDAEIY